MRIVTLVLTAEEPLVLTDGSAESMAHSTLEHIPGSMLLGAFAARWRRRHPGVVPDDDPEFGALFLDGGAEWGCGMPRVAGAASVPIPLCFQKVKNFDGLPAEGGSAGGCLVCNLLRVPDPAAPDGPDNGDGGGPLKAHLVAKGRLGKDEPLKMTKLSAGFMHPETFVRPHLPQGWDMHVSLSADERRAEDGRLFAFSSIAPGAVFESAVVCHDDALADAVLALADGDPVIRVGHARSAGCGRLRLSVSAAGAPAPSAPQGGCADILLLSDYVPRHTWITPLEGLLADLAEALGVAPFDRNEPDGPKLFCAHGAASGFNGLWRLPRRTDACLLRGSVLRVSWQGEARPQPAILSLGARRQEGLGRILINPPCLGRGEDDIVVNPVVPEAPAAKEGPRKPAGKPSPLLRAIRRRSLDRLARDAAMRAVDSEAVRRFLGDISGSPSHAQLGNIRRMISEDAPETWEKSFTAMLGKTPGEQWEKADAPCPFAGRHESLAAIMNRLLKEEDCAGLLDIDGLARNLSGGPADADERGFLLRRAHRIFLFELLAAWRRGKEEQ